jgi:hypothetical protein
VRRHVALRGADGDGDWTNRRHHVLENGLERVLRAAARLTFLRKKSFKNNCFTPFSMSVRMHFSIIFFSWCCCSFALRFLAYEPSEWEAEWAASVVHWRDRECERLGEPRHRNRAEFSVWQAQMWANQTVLNDRPTQLFDQFSIFSRLHCVKNPGDGPVVRLL